MWAWLNRFSSSKSTPTAPPMKSEDYEELMKRLVSVRADHAATAELVATLEKNFRKLEGLYYAKLHEPKKKEEEQKKEEQKQPESEDLSPLKYPFY